MANDFRPGRSPGFARDDGAQLCRGETLRQHLDLRGFARSLAALERDEPSTPGSSFDCLCHDQSFSAPARNIPITSSLAPSIARRIVDPFATGSAATTGASMAILAPRHTLTTPTG